MNCVGKFECLNKVNPFYNVNMKHQICNKINNNSNFLIRTFSGSDAVIKIEKCQFKENSLNWHWQQELVVALFRSYLDHSLFMGNSYNKGGLKLITLCYQGDEGWCLAADEIGTNMVRLLFFEVLQCLSIKAKTEHPLPAVPQVVQSVAVTLSLQTAALLWKISTDRPTFTQSSSSKLLPSANCSSPS